MMNVNSGDNSGMLIVILVIVLAAAAMGIATLLRTPLFSCIMRAQIPFYESIVNTV